MLVAAAIATVAGLLALRWYWRQSELFPSTADASLSAHLVQVRSQVRGAVIEVAVRENQQVRKGDLLFRIDPAPFEARVREAQANLAVVTADVAGDAAQLASLEAAAEAAKQRLLASAAARELAQTLFEEEQRLQAGGAASPRESAQRQADQASAVALEAAAKSALAESEGTLAAARARIGDPKAEAARIDRARAALESATIELGFATVAAPADGWVTAFDLRVGQVVDVGETLFYFVEREPWWIEANFKESQLARIVAGQPVRFTVDMYPGAAFTGRVESLSAGAAAAFSLLPPQNTTGNWVKVTQRVPVRIAVDPPPAGMPFRKGTSVEVTIDTTAAAGGDRAQAETAGSRR
ncbi:MAG TPA: HlyD family secretion protein [Phycisphaerales bacterium]|nr:HlyD family secretion protein [Phycisphaerales bacterium]HMP36366.1 HlyD family secretion protein [Phycisphaerales bacterium]